jgi:hypothetical protein
MCCCMRDRGSLMRPFHILVQKSASWDCTHVCVLDYTQYGTCLSLCFSCSTTIYIVLMIIPPIRSLPLLETTTTFRHYSNALPGKLAGGFFKPRRGFATLGWDLLALLRWRIMRPVKDALETLLTRVYEKSTRITSFISAMQSQRSMEVIAVVSPQLSMRRRSHSNLLLHFEPSMSRGTFPTCHRVVHTNHNGSLPGGTSQTGAPARHVFFAFSTDQSSTSQLFLNRSLRAARSMDHDSTGSHGMTLPYEIRSLLAALARSHSSATQKHGEESDTEAHSSEQ